MTEIYFTDVTPLNDAALFERVVSRLSAEREKKASSCHLERDRNLSAGASYLLSLALAKHGIDEKSVGYVYNSCGKPRLADYPDISFSLSHSGSMAMCALTGSGEVGCDIESPSHHGFAAAKRFFCRSEYLYVTESADPEGEFRRLWTLKESYIKALGTGLKTALSSFEIIPSKPPHIKGNDKYHFAEFLVSGYSAAVCCTDRTFLAPEIINLSNI